MGGNGSSKVAASNSVETNGLHGSNDAQSRTAAVIEPERPVSLTASGEKRYHIFAASAPVDVHISMHMGEYYMHPGTDGSRGRVLHAPLEDSWSLQLEYFLVGTDSSSDLLVCCRISSKYPRRILTFDWQRGPEVTFQLNRDVQITGDNIAISGQFFIRDKTTFRAFPEEPCKRLYYDEESNTLKLGQLDNCDDVHTLQRHFMFDIILRKTISMKLSNETYFGRRTESRKGLFTCMS